MFNWFKRKKKEQEPEIVPQLVEDVVTVTTIMNTGDVAKRVVSYANITNNTLTVYMKNGDILSKVNGDKELHEKVVTSESEDEVYSLMENPMDRIALDQQNFANAQDKVRLEREGREKEIAEDNGLLLKTGEFEVKNGAVYFIGINRSLPAVLVSGFIKIVKRIGEGVLTDDVEYNSLKRFWFWCCLNPRAEVADLLYTFLENNCLRLNRQGFFYALRNVVKVSEDTSLIEFISQSYNHIKAVWKKKPINYTVYKATDGEYRFFKNEVVVVNEEFTLVGNLDEMYKDIANLKENRYTDAHTRKFDIRVGQKVWMDPALCSWSTVECGEKGLHFTMDQINYVGCGDTSVLVLINPAKVVGIGTQKGRCYEYLPVMTVDRLEVTQLLHDKDFDTLELDEWYADEELEDLETKTKENFAVEAQKYDFNLTPISSGDIKTIVNSLSKMKAELKSRVVPV